MKYASASSEYIERKRQFLKNSTLINYSLLCRIAIDPKMGRPSELIDDKFTKRLLDDNKGNYPFDPHEIESAMEDTCRFANTHKYICKYFPTPPNDFPVINIRSYDNQVFMMGGFRDIASGLDDIVIEFDHRTPVSTFLITFAGIASGNARQRFQGQDCGIRQVFIINYQLTRTIGTRWLKE